MSDTNQIEQIVKGANVVLFMKGNKFFPQCGFSARAVAILQRCEASFETVDVLADPAIRENVKAYSGWPTIPQLYIKGEFVGGSDIMMELYNSGELQKQLKGDAS